MLKINKTKASEQDSNVVKLVIITPKDALVLPKLESKSVKPAEQVIQPEEAVITEPLFKVY